jgi:diaminohydroxyphosphoribosylaminopyrimidine deaminase/5-amino-6-(5-phosphoribosylamino)uracil reductase
MIQTKDIYFMKKALALAEKGKGKTNPNPMVGAVVVKKGKIIGKGYHKKAGLPHAEVYALKEAGKNAKGAVLYVTLEPCSTHGRTPPCVPQILDAGIKKVIVAAKDPNPLNKNKGIKMLRSKGIDVFLGMLKNESMKLNEPYNKFITKGIPYVTVKAAMSLDGKIATKTGSSKWISGSSSRKLVKRFRKEADAVLVGRRTYIKDNPRFQGVKNKIILGKAKVNLKNLMKDLAKKGIMHVLIEGGGETIASAIEGKLVDRIYLFIAPKIIGGRNAPTPVDGKGVKNIEQALKLDKMQVEYVGRDILVSGLMKY